MIPFDIKAVIEILIIAVAVYYVYKLFRGTRAASVLTGLVILMVAMIALTELLDLRVLSYILKASSAFLVLALVILFQPELRRVLAQLGSGLLPGTITQQSALIENVIQALEYLRDRKFGALIAFEGTVQHVQTRQSGVAIHGDVSEELLSSIFTTKTPLHDGGVIIAGEKILAAACIFPVTQRHDLNRLLGLRHRAAIGLTEECDATVVVLSEETGELSLCRDGVIERPLSSDALRQRLTEILVVPNRRGGKAGTFRDVFERLRQQMSKPRGNG
jgi:diadenylate cyclase